MDTIVPIGHWGPRRVTLLWPWLSVSSSCNPSYGPDTWRLRASWPGCQVELTGSRDRWVLIEADCWEAASAGCTELFPAAPIVSRSLNPSKCLCALAVWSEGGGPRPEQGQPSPGCLHFPSLLLTHLPIHLSIYQSLQACIHLSIRLSIHPSILCCHSFSLSLMVQCLSTICQEPCWDPIPRPSLGSQSSVGVNAPRLHDGGEHGRPRSTGLPWGVPYAGAAS